MTKCFCLGKFMRCPFKMWWNESDSGVKTIHQNILHQNYVLCLMGLSSVTLDLHQVVVYLCRSQKDDPRHSNSEEMQKWQLDRHYYLECRRRDEKTLMEEHRSTQEMYKKMQVSQNKQLFLGLNIECQEVKKKHQAFFRYDAVNAMCASSPNPLCISLCNTRAGLQRTELNCIYGAIVFCDQSEGICEITTKWRSCHEV